MNQLPYKIDPSSDRYRICPYDGVEFMTSHRSRIFCNPKCADEYHNRKKRLEKEKKKNEKKIKLLIGVIENQDSLIKREFILEVTGAFGKGHNEKSIANIEKTEIQAKSEKQEINEDCPIWDSFPLVGQFFQ